jgi:hypothetical protein
LGAAIYEDQPAGPKLTGIHYRSAYNDGQALALWDCDQTVTALADPTGEPMDLPLRDARILARLQVAMTQRRINVTTADAADCALCSAPG